MKRPVTLAVTALAAASCAIIPAASAQAGTGNSCGSYPVKQTVGLYTSGGNGTSAGTVSLVRGNTNWCAVATSRTMGTNNMRIKLDVENHGATVYPSSNGYIGVPNGGQISVLAPNQGSRGWAWAELVRYSTYYSGHTNWYSW